MLTSRTHGCLALHTPATEQIISFRGGEAGHWRVAGAELGLASLAGREPGPGPELQALPIAMKFAELMGGAMGGSCTVLALAP